MAAWCGAGMVRGVTITSCGLGPREDASEHHPCSHDGSMWPVLISCISAGSPKRAPSAAGGGSTQFGGTEYCESIVASGQPTGR